VTKNESNYVRNLIGCLNFPQGFEDGVVKLKMQVSGHFGGKLRYCGCYSAVVHGQAVR